MSAHLLVWTVALWWYYRAAMWLKGRRRALEGGNRLVLAAAWAFVGLGLVLDALYNLIAGTLMFLDPPRELLFTSRLKRYRAGTGWRARLAGWFCRELLNPYDPGHC